MRQELSLGTIQTNSAEIRFSLAADDSDGGQHEVLVYVRYRDDLRRSGILVTFEPQEFDRLQEVARDVAEFLSSFSLDASVGGKEVTTEVGSAGSRGDLAFSVKSRNRLQSNAVVHSIQIFAWYPNDQRYGGVLVSLPSSRFIEFTETLEKIQVEIDKFEYEMECRLWGELRLVTRSQFLPFKCPKCDSQIGTASPEVIDNASIECTKCDTLFRLHFDADLPLLAMCRYCYFPFHLTQRDAILCEAVYCRQCGRKLRTELVTIPPMSDTISGQIQASLRTRNAY